MTKYVVLRKSKHVNALDIVTIEEAEDEFALELKLKKQLKGNRDVLGVEYTTLKSFLKSRCLCGLWVGIACLEKLKEPKE